MRELLQQYISTATSADLRQLRETSSEAKRNASWLVAIDARIIGMCGIESRSDEATLQCAELRAWGLGFTKLILSTAEVPAAATAFYRKSG